MLLLDNEIVIKIYGYIKKINCILPSYDNKMN
jgi:hypothetical protein